MLQLWRNGAFLPKLLPAIERAPVGKREATDKSDQLSPSVKHEGLHYTSARSGHAVSGHHETTKWDNGYYVTARINGQSVDFLVDTGSTVTMISPKCCERIYRGEKVNLVPTTFQLKGVEGTLISVEGQMNSSMTFNGAVTRQSRIVVADINQDAILGNDFMVSAKCNLCLHRQVINIDGVDVKLWQMPGSTALACRVEVREAVQIPPRSMRLVDITIQNADSLSSTAVLEPAKNPLWKKRSVGG